MTFKMTVYKKQNRKTTLYISSLHHIHNHIQKKCPLLTLSLPPFSSDNEYTVNHPHHFRLFTPFISHLDVRNLHLLSFFIIFFSFSHKKNTYAPLLHTYIFYTNYDIYTRVDAIITF